MEISFQTIFLGIFYHILGLHCFRIGKMQHNSANNYLQKENTYVPILNKIMSNHREIKHNLDKRFFEFNPVSFRKESAPHPTEMDRTKHFNFSPFMSSLDHLRTFSEHESIPTFKSSYISNNKKPKHLKPFVDHFSGVKSFVLHLNNPTRQPKANNKADTSTSQNEKPTSGIENRAFQNSRKEGHTLGNDNSNIVERIDGYDGTNSLKDGNDMHLKLMLSQPQKPIAHSLNENQNKKGTVSDSWLPVQDIEDKSSINNQDLEFFQTKAEPLMTDMEKLYTGNDTDILMIFIGKGKHSKSSDLNTRKTEGVRHRSTMNAPLRDSFYTKSYSPHIVPKLKVTAVPNDQPILEHESTPYFGIDVPTINDFNSFGDFGNMDSDNLGVFGNDIFNNNDIPVENSLGFDQFGDMTDIDEGKLDKPGEEFGDFAYADSKPHFGTAGFADDYGDFEDGFGSFNTDNSDCATIDTKSCTDNSECSCYGLYHCNSGKCITLQDTLTDDDTFESALGEWHDEPVDIESWRK